MSDAGGLITLGDRYLALGLEMAAKATYLRALAMSEVDDAAEPTGSDEIAACLRLAEVARSSGAPDAGRPFAKRAVDRGGGASARLSLGLCLLGAGELAAARFAFAQVLAAAGVSPQVRARALCGRAKVAIAESDTRGAQATCLAAIDELVDAPSEEDGEDGAADGPTFGSAFGALEEAVELAAAIGATETLLQRFDEGDADRLGWRAHLLRAMVLLHAQGDGARAANLAMERALSAALLACPSDRAVRRWLAERWMRRPRDLSARAEAVAKLEALAQEIASAPRSAKDSVELARTWFVLASALAEDPARAHEAEAAWRAGLRLRPGHAGAANQLARLSLARGDAKTALTDVTFALRIDPSHHNAWLTAAQALELTSAGHAPGHAPGDRVARVLEAASTFGSASLGESAARLVTATAEVARGDVLAGVRMRGHRLKNLLGIVAATARSLRKRVDAAAVTSPMGGAAGSPAGGEVASAIGPRLAEHERELESLYHEWSDYLRSMDTVGPRLEVLSVMHLLSEITAQLRGRTQVAVELVAPGLVPSLLGDTFQLREALHNVIANAVEACEDGGGGVTVSVRTLVLGGDPFVEVEIADDGPGIAAADLPRLFSPGFTTKRTGSGIGLAVAERAVAAHQGRISLDSAPGGGTRVTVLLPADLAGIGRVR